MARRRLDPDRGDGVAAGVGDVEFHGGRRAHAHLHGRDAQFQGERAAGRAGAPGHRGGPQDQEDAEGEGEEDELLDAEGESDDGEEAGAGGEDEAPHRDHQTGTIRDGPSGRDHETDQPGPDPGYRVTPTGTGIRDRMSATVAEAVAPASSAAGWAWSRWARVGSATSFTSSGVT